MKAIDFKESTKILTRPHSLAKSECESLPVWSDGQKCISAWKPSIKERLSILLGGKIWLGVLSGGTQPAVFISGTKVFNKKKKH